MNKEEKENGMKCCEVFKISLKYYGSQMSSLESGRGLKEEI